MVRANISLNLRRLLSPNFDSIYQISISLINANLEDICDIINIAPNSQSLYNSTLGIDEDTNFRQQGD